MIWAYIYIYTHTHNIYSLQVEPLFHTVVQKEIRDAVSNPQYCIFTFDEASSVINGIKKMHGSNIGTTELTLLALLQIYDETYGMDRVLHI